MTAEPRFLAPGTLAEALEAHAADDALALAGGTSLSVLLRSRLVEASTLVYLGRIPELARLQRDAGGLRLGAGCTYHQLARSGEVAAAAPELAAIAARIANPRVRSVATVGGALAHGDPRQDLPCALVALGATVRIASPSATRSLPVAELPRGLMDTALSPDELLVEVLVPERPGRRLAYERFTPTSDDDFPTVAAAASVVREGSGAIAHVALAVGASAPTVFTVPAAERLAGDGDPSPEEVAGVAEAAAAASRPVADRQGSVAYKREMVQVHARRALERALGWRSA